MDEHDFVPANALIFPCETCGFPIEMVQFEDGCEWFIRPHFYCTEPKLTMVVDNPRKLGVVTGLT